ncbi:cell surface glycoprotein CD200 receptor 2-like [Polypterus senegalus]|uniref:cell surface glycoprotein CD200 receptor 2-like n=1 Tax=Polypterus senegalus TaxID=55291 RepID=UPI00196644AD|nr:cell surface glycoprotein CD200 receptor 2-like [Polypterus senegalus]
MDVEVCKSINLTCGNFTNKDILHVIWEIEPYVGKSCRLAKSKIHPPEDSCKDRRQVKSKIGRNNTEEQFYLHIPEVEYRHEGIYKCEAVYNGGAWKEHIYLNATVPPDIFTSIKRTSDAKLMLVCQAANAKPAGNIFWSPWKNSSQKHTTNSNGTITVESWVIIPANETLENVFCNVQHKAWSTIHYGHFENLHGEENGLQEIRLWMAIPVILCIVFLVYTH